jgi:hypothetical protein
MNIAAANAIPVKVEEPKVLENKQLPKKFCELTCCEKIKKIALVTFSVLLCAALYWVNPATFFVSFVVGIAFSKVMSKAVDKIKTFISQHKWPAIVGFGVVCFFSLPVFFAVGTAAWGLFCGSYLSNRAQESFKADLAEKENKKNENELAKKEEIPADNKVVPAKDNLGLEENKA